MKTTRLLFAAALLAFAFFGPTPVQAQWCQDINGAYWCGDPEACQGICSDPGSDCTTPCKRLTGTWTTCGGGSETDSDSDGIGNDVDNCTCTSNSSQADCDQDGMGDVCDAANEKWVPVTSVSQCDWDMDWHFGYGEVEKWGTQQYKNICNNALCNNSVLMDDKKCYGYTDGYACCYDNFGYSVCATDNQCPADSCPF
jgi:hypothetical protein